jgi:hypothetical protein
MTPRGLRFLPVLAFTLALSTRGTAQAPSDSARADSIRRAGGDSAAPTSPGAPTAERVPPAVGPGSVGTDPATIPLGVGPAEPADTTLARACLGYPAGSEAPGILAVIFSPGTSADDRAAAAKAVGGTLAGSSPYGEDYVRLAVGAGPLAGVADRLIRQRPVKQVSPAPCPAPPAMPSAGGAAPGGDSVPAPAADSAPSAGRAADTTAGRGGTRAIVDTIDAAGR